MRVLIDECLPRQIKGELGGGHLVETVYGAGWVGFKNGNLLALANRDFDVLVTADRNIHYQQRFDELSIALVVLPTNRLGAVRAALKALEQTLDHVLPGQHIYIDLPLPIERWQGLTLLNVVQDGDFIRHEFGTPAK